MINEQSIMRVLVRTTDDEEINKETIQDQIGLIAKRFELPKKKVEWITRLVWDMGMQWECPNCGFKDCVSYVDVANIGTPICPDCDEEME